MTRGDWQEAIEVTAIGDLMVSVVMTLLWKLTGWWIRKRNVTPSSRPVACRFADVLIVAIIVLFVTIPMVIIGSSNTYPRGSDTLGYLCLSMSVVADNCDL